MPIVGDNAQRLEIEVDNMVRIGILEDDPEIRDYLDDVFAELDGFEVSFSEPLIKNAKYKFSSNGAIDLCLVDLQLPDGNGSEFISYIRENSDTKCLVLTVLGDKTSVIAAFEAGADGYLIKDAEEWEIIKYCRKTLEGVNPISPQAATHLLSLFRDRPIKKKVWADDDPDLSDREKEILTLFAKGLSYKEAGGALGLSVHTINDYVKSIYSKLSVHSKNEAVFEALQMGWIEI